jgi:hypothetical protein
MNRTMLAAGVTLAALLAAPLATPALAQETRADKPVQPAEEPGASPSAEPPDAMDEMAGDPTAPGPEHKLLEQFEGKWDAKMTGWFGPDMVTGGGTMTNTLVLDGRFLRHEFRGTMAGQRFEGLGYWGYDRAKKEWHGSWMDTWSTGMMASHSGTYDPRARAWTSMGTYFNPQTMQEEKQKEVVTLLDSETHKMEMFMIDPDGTEHKSLEILYTRAGRGAAPGQIKKDERKPEGKPEKPGRR